MCGEGGLPFIKKKNKKIAISEWAKFQDLWYRTLEKDEAALELPKFPK